MTEQTTDSAVDIRELSKRYDSTEAVDKLSLTVKRGEMFGLVGPDGAGKTTTIRMLCGAVMPDSGSATVLGYDILTEIGIIKQEIGYLSQKFSLYGDLSVDENIEFFAEIHNVRDFSDRRNRLLEFTRLTQFRNRLADQLSGGMKQKLALACTLIHTPKLIFLDEPTVGVDPVSRRDFWMILSDLLRQGITIFLTTPYLDEAERCTRVALMNEGNIMVCDTPGSVKQLMNGTMVELIATDMRRVYNLLKNSPQIAEVQAFGDRVHVVVRDNENYEEVIGRMLAAKGIEIRSIRRIAPSLENVFISMVRAVETR